ncbi:MAG: DUF2608 domain-containing protein [Bacteroidota bacterium]
MRSLKIILITLCFAASCSMVAQKNDLLPIEVVKDSTEFTQIIENIKGASNALFVFDVDNTLIITNDNGFGSDWWYTQTKTNPSLKLGVDNTCLFDVLTPLFYSMFETTDLFEGQSTLVDGLGKRNSSTIALTSRGYTESVANSTELALRKNEFTFINQDSVYLAKNVVMLNGVIYTKGQNKGDVLLKYIEDKSYDQIFYFDDSLFKVEDVQEAFSDTDYNIELYHMKVAAKVPYSSTEIDFMKGQLCNLIQTISNQGDETCTCGE